MFLGEHLTYINCVGLVVLVLGVALFNYTKYKKVITGQAVSTRAPVDYEKGELRAERHEAHNSERALLVGGRRINLGRSPRPCSCGRYSPRRSDQARHALWHCAVFSAERAAHCLNAWPPGIVEGRMPQVASFSPLIVIYPAQECMHLINCTRREPPSLPQIRQTFQPERGPRAHHAAALCTAQWPLQCTWSGHWEIPVNLMTHSDHL